MVTSRCRPSLRRRASRNRCFDPANSYLAGSALFYRAGALRPGTDTHSEPRSAQTLAAKASVKMSNPSLMRSLLLDSGGRKRNTLP